jgi:leader peptidase (prepilin peptidase)/N-methyltransferase
MDFYWKLIGETPQWFWLGVMLIYGAIIGSFLNVCIYRIPRGQDIVSRPSFCPECDERIPWYLNIPIVSWFILLGKTRCCGKHLKFRYPLVESSTAILTTVLYHQYGLSFLFLGSWLFTCMTIVLIFIDWEHMRLPNVLTIPGIVLGLGFALFGEGRVTIVESVLGAVVGAGGMLIVYYFYKIVRGIEGMGMGDVKLMAMIGAFLGWRMTFPVVIIGAFLALVYGVVVMVRTGAGGKTAIPFGVFLGIAAIAMMFWGDALMDWYMGFFAPIQ